MRRGNLLMAGWFCNAGWQVFEEREECERAIRLG
jgi:hypothetical protein